MYPVGSDEDVRLAALQRLNILDTPSESAYDDIVELVRHILDVPIALVSLVDRDRQWFKARAGLAACETSLEVSFCAHVIAQRSLEEPFIIPDARVDPRFSSNPLVTGDPHIRMYVGIALLSPDGQPLGSLCAIDTRPRTPTVPQVMAMRTLARSVNSLLALRQSMHDLRESEERNRLIVATARDAAVSLSADGCVLSWNDVAVTMFDRQPWQAIGRPFAPLAFGQANLSAREAEFVALLEGLQAGGPLVSRHVELRRASGTPFPADLSAARLSTRRGEIVSLFIRDTSEHARREQLERENQMRDVTIYTMAKLAESRDPETGAHIERVQHYCKALAEQLLKVGAYCEQADEEFVRLMYTTSPLHDIGKVGIPDDVLLKPGRLSDREFEIMKSHAAIGRDTLNAALDRFPNTRFLRMARNIAATHHERFDGTGYPDGLAGTDIPLCGRIVALADVYDALTSRRVYKAAFTHEIARNILIKESGKQFDPIIVEAFLAVEDRFQAIRSEFTETIAEAA